jgi:beta-phosphoglucomutase-like phosphatase (HAD superfamily)
VLKDWKDSLITRLDQLASGARVKLIMVVDFPQTQDESAPTPEMFATRREYRQALVAHKERRIRPKVCSVVHDLRQLGLVVAAAPLSGSVIAEGNAQQLKSALELHSIVAACTDARLSLLEPKANHRNDIDS